MISINNLVKTENETMEKDTRMFRFYFYFSGGKMHFPKQVSQDNKPSCVYLINNLNPPFLSHSLAHPDISPRKLARA
jgi:hypothetical protein